MFEVEQDEGGFGDRADPPGTHADPSQGLGCGLEQRVRAFGAAVYAADDQVVLRLCLAAALQVLWDGRSGSNLRPLGIGGSHVRARCVQLDSTCVRVNRSAAYVLRI